MKREPSARTLAEMERGRQIQQLRANPPSPLQQLLSARYNPDHVDLMEVEVSDWGGVESIITGCAREENKKTRKVTVAVKGLRP